MALLFHMHILSSMNHLLARNASFYYCYEKSIHDFMLVMRLRSSLWYYYCTSSAPLSTTKLEKMNFYEYLRTGVVEGAELKRNHSLAHSFNNVLHSHSVAETTNKLELRAFKRTENNASVSCNSLLSCAISPLNVSPESFKTPK